MAPVSWNGSEMIYRQVIRPFFLKHQTAMDNIVNDLSSKAMALSEDAAKKGEVAHIHACTITSYDRTDAGSRHFCLLQSRRAKAAPVQN